MMIMMSKPQSNQVHCFTAWNHHFCVVILFSVWMIFVPQLHLFTKYSKIRFNITWINPKFKPSKVAGQLVTLLSDPAFEWQQRKPQLYQRYVHDFCQCIWSFWQRKKDRETERENTDRIFEHEGFSRHLSVCAWVWRFSYIAITDKLIIQSYCRWCKTDEGTQGYTVSIFHYIQEVIESGTGWRRELGSDYIKPIYRQKCDCHWRRLSRSLSARSNFFVVITRTTYTLSSRFCVITFGIMASWQKSVVNNIIFYYYIFLPARASF